MKRKKNMFYSYITKEHLYATSFQHDEEIYSVVQNVQ